MLADMKTMAENEMLLQDKVRLLECEVEGALGGTDNQVPIAVFSRMHQCRLEGPSMLAAEHWVHALPGRDLRACRALPCLSGSRLLKLISSPLPYC